MREAHCITYGRTSWGRPTYLHKIPDSIEGTVSHGDTVVAADIYARLREVPSKLVSSRASATPPAVFGRRRRRVSLRTSR